MNQVQEMFKLNDVARTDEALVRLGGLFDVMAQQPGFLHAEVTRDATDDKTLLVFHAWAQLENWQAFQASQWKIDFMAHRPEGLYSPVPVGMNWTLVAGEETARGGYIRRAFSETDLSGFHAQLFSAAGTDDSYPARWMALEHAAKPAPGEGWFEVLLTRARDAIVASV